MNAEVEAPSRPVVRLPRFPSVLQCTMPAGQEPCGQTGCRYHLAHRRSGEHKLEPMRDCALTVANEGTHTLEQVAQMFGVTREWVRKMEGSALDALYERRELRSQYDDEADEADDLRSTAFAFARAYSAERGQPIRLTFDDSLAGDRARIDLRRRLRGASPGTPVRTIDELIEEFLTP